MSVPGTAEPLGEAVPTSFGAVDAWPSGIRAAALRQLVQDRLIHSSDYLLSVCAEGLNRDLSGLRKTLAEVRPGSPLGPGLFVWHERFHAALGREAIPEIEALLGRAPELLQPDGDGMHIVSAGGNWLAKEARKIFDEEAEGLSTALNPLPDSALRQSEGLIHRALDCLEVVDPEAHREVATLVHTLWLCDSAAFQGASSFSFFSGMFLSLPEHRGLDYWVEWLVHEAAHIHLHAVLCEDALVENEPTARYDSPLRPDPRPMVQIVHAAFVLARVIHSFVGWRNRAAASPEPLPAGFADRLSVLSSRYLDAAEVLQEHAVWTEAGRELLASLNEMVEQLLGTEMQQATG